MEYLTTKVSFDWLKRHRMLKHGNVVGVPVDLYAPKEGVRWKSINNLTEEDIDIIDKYFNLNQK